MSVASVGTPTITTGTASPATSAWGTGQARTAGNLLVAVVTFNATTSAAATAQNAGTTGWTNVKEIGSAGTALARVAIWTKTATGADAAPAFTSATAGTVQCSVTLYELSGANQLVDTSGTNAVAAGTVTAQTVTTAANVSIPGEFGIAGFARERASTASVITASGTYGLDTSNTAVASIGHSATMSLASPAAGATSSATVNYSLAGTTANAAAALVIFGSSSPGPADLSASQPAGVRVIRLRKGFAGSTTLAVPAIPPTSGPRFFPATQPIRARVNPARDSRRGVYMGAAKGDTSFGTGQIQRNAGGPVQNPQPGPVFRPAVQAVRTRIPPVAQRYAAGLIYATMTGSPAGPPMSPYGSGRILWNCGGPVQNPVPVVMGLQQRRALRAQVPPHPRAGRISASFGGPVQNPAPGPVFRPRGAVQARYSPKAFAAGLVYGSVAPGGDASYGSGRCLWSPGAPVRNPAAVMVFVQHQAVRAKVPQQLGAGLTYGSTAPGGDASYGSGRVLWSPGAPVNNPAPGPVFRQRTTPVRFILPPWHPTAGRIGFNKGAAVLNPIHGPPAYPLPGPVRGRIPRPFAGSITAECAAATGNVSAALNGSGFGCAIGCNGAPVRNPAPGPQFSPATSPARAKLPPQPVLRGRSASSAGAPVRNPPPVFTQKTSPSRARILPPPRGRAYASVIVRVTVPQVPAPFYPKTSPVRAQLPLPLRGKCRAVSPFTITLPAGVSAPFYARVQPVRAVIPQTAPRGRVSAGKGAPVRNPQPGPAFRQATSPARARVPQTFSRGRAAGNPGAPVRNPVPGPVFAQKTWPVQAPDPLPKRGRVYGISSGGPLRNPAQGPVFPAAVRPARAPVPQVFSKGRASGNPGGPQRNPVMGPAFRQAVSPARARTPLPPRGRCASNPGGPVRNPSPVIQGPPFYPVTRVRPQPGPRPGGIFAAVQAAPAQASASTISYNTGATASAITATSVGLTIPAGVLVNDLMVLAVTLFTQDASAPAVSITGGTWTLTSVTTGTNPEVPAGAGVFSYDYAYTRTATGIDPGATITFSETGSGAGATWWGVALAAYTGAGSVDVAGGANAQGGGGTTVTCPSGTTVQANDWAVYLGGGAPGGGSTWITPAGTTVRKSVVSAAGIGAVITDSNGALGSGSSIGGGTFKSSNPGATVWLSAFTLGIEPQVTPAAPATQASQFFTGRTGFSYGAPVQNPVTGAPAPALHSPVRARQPLPLRGRTGANPGGPFVSPPVTGPVFTQRTSPARIRPSLPPRGRIASGKGAPVRNPAAGPAFRQATSPARSRIPQVTPRGIYASFEPFPPSAPVSPITYNTGAAGSAITATSVGLTIPAGVLAGDVMLLSVTVFTEDSSAPAITIPAGWNLLPAATGTNPEIATAGSSIWSYGYAYYKVANNTDPGSGLTVSETGSPFASTWWAIALAAYTGAAAAGTIDVAGGANAQGGTGTTVTCPAETTGAAGDWAVYLGGGAPSGAFTTPAGTTTRQNIVSGASVGAIITDSNGPAGAGAVIGGGTFGSTAPGAAWLTAFTVGLAATVGTVPRQEYAGFYATGRVAWSPGGPLENPPTSGPVVYPLHSPVQAKALPRRRALCRAIRFVPLTGNPAQGPQFYPAVEALRARLPVPFLKGRVSSNAGTPSRNPGHGPVFRQADSPAVARRPLPPRGRIASNRGAPVQNPQPGPVFRQATAPARIRPAPPPRGRAGSNPGGPVQNPPPPVNGPVFRPATSPARIRPSLPPRGRVASNAGAPVRNPVQGAAFPAQHKPVQARLPLPPRGRTSGNRGVLAVVTAPVPVYPLHGPVMARRPLPPRGRITGNPGAPARNPHQGPVFRQLNWPARTRVPRNAPRGRIWSNPGGPVENIPFATLRFRTGIPFFRWATGSPFFQWATGTPGSQWAPGSPFFQWAPGTPGFQQATGTPQAG